MRLHLYVSLVLVLLQISIFAQSTLEKEIAKIKDHPGIKLNYLDDSRLSVSYYDRQTRIFNLGKNTNLKQQTDSFPIFSITLWGMDTTLFTYKFKFDQEVELTDCSFPALLGDINNNGKVEYYGIKKGYYTEFSEVYCYEQNQNGIFQEVYKYPSNTIAAFKTEDLDRDGKEELHILATHQDSISHYIIHDQTFFKKPAEDSLATSFYFAYNIYQGGGLNIQLNDFTIGDFDNDSLIEGIFYNIAPQEIHIVKFDKDSLDFNPLLIYPTTDIEAVAGFPLGDFDMDGNTDILYSSEYGNIYILEYEQGNYTITWKGNTGTWNCYINFKTNDIDGNGKPEFWIGGQTFTEGVTRLFCYESDGDNSYHCVTEINFPGLLSFSGLDGKSIDVDNDGKEELFIHNGDVVIIMKFNGKPNNPDYQLYYFHVSDYGVDAANIYQFPNEKYPSIVLSMYQSTFYYTRVFSWIFKHYLITAINEEQPELINGYELFNNYPNPFNPSTTIRFSIPKRNEVRIKVFNSLGEEVNTLFKKTLERGEHQITWNGLDKNNNAVPSGVYFIAMEASDFHKTIKALLIK